MVNVSFSPLSSHTSCTHTVFSTTHLYVHMYALVHIAQSGVEDTSNFESRFTTLPAVDSPVEAELSFSATQAFTVRIDTGVCVCVCVYVCVCV